MFSFKWRYLCILGLGTYSYFNTWFVETFKYYSIDENPLLILGALISVSLFVWEGNRFLEKVVLPKLTRFKNPIVSFFLLSHVIAFLAAVIVYFLFVILILGKSWQSTSIDAKLILIFSFRVNLFLQCINTIVFYVQRFKQEQIEAEQLRRISSMASLQAIRNQVNPHFLFNNLNVLSSLVMQKNEDANNFIEKFSSVYRYILSNQQKELVQLSEELEFIKPYLYLLEKRFGEALQVVIDVSARYESEYIVPVALQMLVENAIKHNIVSSKKPLSIRIYVKDEYLVVENNLQLKKEKEPSSNIGLNNINQRYKMVTGKETKIFNDHSHFSVAIPLVKIRAV